MNYKKLVESLTPKENRLKNMLIAFFIWRNHWSNFRNFSKMFLG